MPQITVARPGLLPRLPAITETLAEIRKSNTLYWQPL
jgi:hypothetical protein